MTTSAASWLSGQGLSAAAVSRVAHLSLAQLKGLALSDCAALGLSGGEAQQLWRCLRSLSSTTSPQLTPQPSGGIRWGPAPLAATTAAARASPPAPPNTRRRHLAAAGPRRMRWWTWMATTTTS